MECPRTEVFQLLLTGQLSPEQQGPLADHAAACPDCHAVVEAMVTRRGEAPPDARRPAPGAVIGGRFRIDQVVGAGGMGVVMAATHLELGHRVAIKFMREEKLASGVTAERFIREARAVVKLRTDHVCRVLDVARLETGAPYIVMELLDGVDLARTIAARPLPTTIAVEYVMQATVALAEAHAAGIVHRDLKPANLFVTRRPDGGPLVKVLDFGVAKAIDSDARLTRTRAMLGSPAYMSPEQLASARDVDARTDVWALGVTLYQLLSGRLPFPGRTQAEIAVKISGERPAPLEVDPRLRAVVLRCLEKVRGDRYPDVVALAADLVPFGGPRARGLAATVARVANETAVRSTTPGPAPAGGPAMPVPVPVPVPTVTAPTPREPGRAASHRVGAARRSPVTVAPRRTRIGWFAAPALAILAAIGVWVAVHGRQARTRAPAPGPAPAHAVATAAPVLPASPAVSPGPPAASAATPPAASPAAGAVGAVTREPPDPPARTQPMTLAGVAAERRQACEALTRPPRSDTTPPANLVMCWCELHDQANAQAAFARVAAPRDREDLRRLCAPHGVDLP